MAITPDEKKVDITASPEQILGQEKIGVDQGESDSPPFEGGARGGSEIKEVISTDVEREAIDESKEVQKEEVAAEAPSVAPAQVTESLTKDPGLKQIEDVLAEDLTDLFLALPDEKKSAFKQKGEEIAQNIQVMIATGKVKAKRILDMIREWLSMVPGVNKFFLEQESKIKTDKILNFAQAKSEVSGNTV